MKTLLELKIISATVDGERLDEKISLAVRTDTDGYVKYSLWRDWNTSGCPLCETNLRLDDNLPTGPTEGESIENFNKRVIDLLQANNWIVDHVVKPFRKTGGELKRYKYNLYNEKVETEIPEKAFGFYIDPSAEQIRDSILKELKANACLVPGEYKNECILQGELLDEHIEEVYNDGRRDGDPQAYSEMVRLRVEELLDNHEKENDSKRTT